MERHYSYSVPIRDDSLRQLHFIRSTGTGSKVDQKMLPIQKHKKIVKNAAQDDERDDAFVASKRRNGYGWDNSDPRKHASSNERLALMGGRRSRERHFISPRSQGLPAWQQSTTWRNVRSYDWQGRSHRSPGMVPISQIVQKSSRSTHHLPTLYHASEDSMRMKYESEKPTRFPSVSYPPQQVSTSSTRTRSKVIIPNSLVLPKSLISSSTMREPRSSQDSIVKRAAEPNGFSPPLKRAKRVLQPLEGHFDKLALLCKATLDLGPLLDNPAGCSCPKSKCIALYCDCFKAGRRCSPACSCLDCKNTVEESGPNGARSKAIQSILARNPRAFINAGNSNTTKVLPGEEGCNCIRSRCLKLYCTCFQGGKPCNPSVCTCVGCLNTNDDTTGQRKAAIQMTLEKRPDAFRQKSKTKETGSGCACKNNRCIKKYCECFRTGLLCTNKCKCKNCENHGKSRM